MKPKQRISIALLISAAICLFCIIRGGQNGKALQGRPLPESPFGAALHKDAFHGGYEVGIITLGPEFCPDIRIDAQNGQNIRFRQIHGSGSLEIRANRNQIIPFGSAPGGTTYLPPGMAFFSCRAAKQADIGSQVAYCKFYGTVPPRDWYAEALLCPH